MLTIKKLEDMTPNTILKDKNAKEIYFDCSIFKIEGYSGFYMLTKDDFGIPMMFDGKDVVNSISLETLIFSKNIYPKDFEVIGNKFENPELLETTKWKQFYQFGY